MKTKNLTTKEVDKILSYRGKGLSLRETAKLLGGITYETIRTIEKKYGNKKGRINKKIKK